jgi:ABC-type cobalamin/Fe3+-siderophores transport system ATPase subunit
LHARWRRSRRCWSWTSPASLDFGNQIRVLEQIEALSPGHAMLLSTHQPEHGFACG